MTKKIYLMFLWILLPGLLLAQEKVTVKGKITDGGDGSTIPGVSIQIKGTSIGTTSDVEGNYVLSAETGSSLVFSFIGFKSIEEQVGSRTAIDVQLQPESTQLNDVVVVGYGTQEKKDITGAIASINNKDFANQPTTNLAGNLQGKLAGVNVTSTSGTPGAGLAVSVRGASNPLYVIDGVPMLSESNSSLATSFDTEGNVVGSGQNLSSISDINPNDIESIEVLKDASAAAIYGSRAANGVVLITTKRGKAGKTKFNVNYYTGTQQPTRKIKFLDSKGFIDLIEDARAQDLKRYQADNTIFDTPTSTFDPTVLTDPLNYSAGTQNTVWLDEVLKTAPINNYEISANGGDQKTKFYVAGSYFDQTGMVIENFYKRLNSRINLDHQATDKFSIGVNATVTHSRNRRSFNDNTYTGVITNALGASPLMPVYDANGNYSAFEDYEVSWLSDNPVKSAKEIEAFTTTNRLIGSMFGEYKFTEDLKFRTSWSVDYSDLRDEQFFSPLTADAQSVSGRAFRSNYNSLTWLNENILSYNKRIGEDHAINAIAGFTLQETTSDLTSTQAQGFPTGSGLKNISSAAVINNSTGVGASYGLQSFLGRVNYDFKGKYLLSATIRSDGSSRFSKDKRYGVFPSASVGWRISQEDFFGKDGVISNLKLRTSYGVTGDQDIGNYQSTSFYQPSRYNGTPGLRPRNLADPSLTWQSNSTFNIGVDYEMWEGRISGSIEYFKSDKTNILSEDNIVGTTGFQTITRNAGKIENRGWEISVSSINVSTTKFKWRTEFNISFIKNEIKRLSNNGLLISAYNDLAPTHILQEGQAQGSFWAIQYMGVDAQTGDAMYYDLGTQQAQSINSGLIDSDDSQISGKAIPDYYGGFNNYFNYGKWDFTLATQFSVGNKIFNLIRPTYENLGWSNEGGLDQVYANNYTEVDKRWKKPGDNTDIPRASFINKNYIENSTQYIEDGSFFRFRTLGLGYTLKPGNGSTSLRVYGQVQNLAVITKYKGFDPEVSSTGAGNPQTAGVDYAAYPQPRTITFGFNFTF